MMLQKWHTKIGLFFVVLTISLAPFKMMASMAWDADYKKALEKGREESKPLLLYFTGSDCSGWSMKMKNEILDSEPFQSIASSSFICVEVDFPEHKTIPQEIKAQNELLKQRFNVTGYPVLVLLDAQEREIVRFGYVPDSGSHLARDLLHIIEQDNLLTNGLANLSCEPQNLKKLYSIATELRRQDAIDRIILAGLTIEEPFFLLERYRLLVERGEMESAKATLIRNKLTSLDECQVHFTVALVEFQELAKQIDTLEDRNKVIKPLEDYLCKFAAVDQENVWRIEMMIAQFYLEADEWQGALKHAEIAYKTAPEQMREEIKHSIDYIQDREKSVAAFSFE